MPLGIVVDNPDQDSRNLPTDPFAGLFGYLKSLQARSMKISAQLFVTPRCLPIFFFFFFEMLGSLFFQKIIFHSAPLH